jgi:hypothetical protein
VEKYSLFNVVNIMYPIHSVYLTLSNSNPHNLPHFQHTQWLLISEGRYIAGVGSTTSGGITYTVPLTGSGATTSIVTNTYTVTSTNTTNPSYNTIPYYGVYMWRRTS